MLSLFTKPTQPEVYREPTQDERAALYAARERAALAHISQLARAA